MGIEILEINKDNLAKTTFLSMLANVSEVYNTLLAKDTITIDENTKILSQIMEAYSFYNTLQKEVLDADISSARTLLDTLTTTLNNLLQFKGEKGDKGDKGERGLQGIQGIQGLTGAFPNAQTFGTLTRFGGGANNGVDALQVNGSIDYIPRIIFSSPLSGTFDANEWYTVPKLDVSLMAMTGLFLITIYDNSYLLSQRNYYNTYTFLAGGCSINTNAVNRLPIQLLSRIGHACNGYSISLSYELQGGPQHLPLLQFSLGGGGIFDQTAGKELNITIRKLF